MGSLHCARICMDVIAALIGRCRHSPASYPGSPRLADSAARGPAPRNEAVGPRGRGGVGGSRGRRGRGGLLHSTACWQGAGTGALARWRAARAQPAVGGLAGSGQANWKTRGWLFWDGRGDTGVPRREHTADAQLLYTHAWRAKVSNGQEKKMLRGQGKRGAGSSISSCFSCRSAWLPSTQGASSQGPAHPGSFPALRILKRIGYASVKSGDEP